MRDDRPLEVLTDLADMAEKTPCNVCGERLCRASTCQRCLADLESERPEKQAEGYWR